MNLDFGLFRTFRLSERIQMQFRAEAFNFTNTPHFANPSDAQATISNRVLNADGTYRSWVVTRYSMPLKEPVVKALMRECSGWESG